jgi:hypothetical protein
MLEKGKFSSQIKVFGNNPQADIVYGEVRYFTTENLQARFRSIDCGFDAWMPESTSQNQVQLIKDLFRINLFAVNCP